MMKKDTPPSPPKKRSVLGRGLESLIPVNAPDATEETPYFLCDTDLIRPNRYQPRIQFADDELSELAASIREQGVLQPLLVRKNGVGYELVAGERRLRASKLAGLAKVPVVIKDLSDKELLELALIENIQRENLNPLEEAEAYHRLMEEFSITQEEAGRRVGKSRSAVANIVRLRQLPDPVKQGILDSTLSMGHARALLGADTPAQQKAVFREILDKGLSVRQTEALVKKVRADKKPAPSKAPDSDGIYFKSLAEELSRKFGTKVRILRQGKQGTVELAFYNDDDLDRLLSSLKAV